MTVGTRSYTKTACFFNLIFLRKFLFPQNSYLLICMLLFVSICILRKIQRQHQQIINIFANNSPTLRMVRLMFVLCCRKYSFSAEKITDWFKKGREVEGKFSILTFHLLFIDCFLTSLDVDCVVEAVIFHVLLLLIRRIVGEKLHRHIPITVVRQIRIAPILPSWFARSVNMTGHCDIKWLPDNAFHMTIYEAFFLFWNLGASQNKNA